MQHHTLTQVMMSNEVERESLSATNPEVGQQIGVKGIRTNYHDVGSGAPVLLLHGSGPGVSAWANWRLALPAIAETRRVIAPDLIGFGFTERPNGISYNVDNWLDHTVGLLDALGLQRVDVVGNSFGGSLALKLALRNPRRIGKVVLMGAASLSFPLTNGLNQAWGYEPSLQNMRKLLDIFAHDRSLVTDELAKLRHRASIRKGVHEAYASMFPAPRQRWVDVLASAEGELEGLCNQTLIVHGREDRVIPYEVSERAFRLIGRAEFHGFGQCGHWVQIENSSRFNQLVIDFLGET